MCGPITEKVTAESMQCQTNDDIELDVIEPPVVPSQLEFVSKRNSKYTSKTIQNDIMQEKLTGELRSQNIPFTICEG